MKHLMALAAACLLLWSFAAAETDALARYDELERQAAAAVLEMEIVQLERQIAQLRGDQAAISAADEKESSILAWQEEIRLAMADLAIPLVMALEERADTLDQEIQALQAQLEDINAAIRESSAARKDALALRSELLRNYGLTASAAGYGGNVTVRLLQDDNGCIAYMLVEAPRETPAIAMPCTEEAFLSQFIGRSGPFTDVDTVAGATYTSNAVINAVNSLYPNGKILTGKAHGFISDVTVALIVTNGVITGVSVDSAGETPGFGTRCGEDIAFFSQFIGKRATPDLGEGIDALAGATVTSKAVIEAANAAIGVAEEVVLSGETLTASARGRLSDVQVTVTLNEDGTIATLEVDASGETEFIARPCTEEAFLSQFIGRSGPFDDVDTVTGATYTSNAVINALNSLYPGEGANAE